MFRPKFVSIVMLLLLAACTTSDDLGISTQDATSFAVPIGAVTDDTEELRGGA